MRIIRLLFPLIVPVVIGSGIMVQTASINAQAVNNDRLPVEKKAGEQTAHEQRANTEFGTVSATISGLKDSGLENYCDKSMGSVPTHPVSIRYVVEHRSALNGKTIIVNGIVVRTLWPSDVKSSGRELSMSNPQPRIFIADSADEDRDMSLDLMVLLREGDHGYEVGQLVNLSVSVESNKTVVVLRKIY